MKEQKGEAKILAQGGGIIKILCEKVVEKYGDMVYRIAISNTKKKEDAEDIFQEVFVSLIRNMDKIEDERHLKYWLIRTCINFSKNLHLSFWKKRVTFELKDKDDIYNTYESDFDTEIDALRDEIKHLPAKQKAVIYLYYYEEYAIKEIAEILEISEGTVKSRLSNARNNLKINLERSLNG